MWHEAYVAYNLIPGHWLSEKSGVCRVVPNGLVSIWHQRIRIHPTDPCCTARTSTCIRVASTSITTDSTHIAMIASLTKGQQPFITTWSNKFDCVTVSAKGLTTRPIWISIWMGWYGCTLINIAGITACFHDMNRCSILRKGPERRPVSHHSYFYSGSTWLNLHCL